HICTSPTGLAARAQTHPPSRGKPRIAQARLGPACPTKKKAAPRGGFFVGSHQRCEGRTPNQTPQAQITASIKKRAVSRRCSTSSGEQTANFQSRSSRAPAD